MSLKYGTILQHKTGGYTVKVGMGYVQENVQKYFLVFEDHSSRLIREDVIMQHFEVMK